MKKIIFTVMAMAGILLMAGCPNGSTEEDIKSSEKSITSFKFKADNNDDALSEDVTGSIDEGAHAITLTVPYGTILTALKPSISLSAGATVNPASNTAGDFTSPVSYTVTAQDGSTQNYRITVNVASANTGKSITSFKFEANNNAALSEDVPGSINGNAITLTVPYGTNVTALVPTISLSPEATVTPASGTAGDFTNPVSYTVTAQDNTTQNYTVTVNVASNSAKSITSFKFEANNNAALSEDVTGSINGNAITLRVPYGTALTALKPTISLSAGARVNPVSGTAGDFTSPVSYTVTAEDNTTQNYTVTVNVAPGYNITVSPSGAEGSESVTADYAKASEGVVVTLTANNLGTGRQAALNASDISISPAVITTSGGSATFTMPDEEITITANLYSIETRTAASVHFDMHLAPHGSFEMGDANVSNATPVHTVTLTKDFWMGKTEVTQGLWEAVWGSTWPGTAPSVQYGKGENYPAYFVSWYDTAAFCNELTKADNSIDDNQQVYYSNEALTTAYTKTDAASYAAVYADWNKKGYRLPTEAEWEYAARYIDGTQWNGGDHVSGDTSTPHNTSNVKCNYAWYSGNNGSMGAPDYGSKEVGQKTANALGLKDMSGNVWEWCYDKHGNYGSSSQIDPVGPGSGSKRVIRGGNWYHNSYLLEVGYRDHKKGPSSRTGARGFRLCRTAD